MATARATCSGSCRGPPSWPCRGRTVGALDLRRRARRPGRRYPDGPGLARTDPPGPPAGPGLSASPRPRTSIATAVPDLIAIDRLPRVPRGDRRRLPGTTHREQLRSTPSTIPPRRRGHLGPIGEDGSGVTRSTRHSGRSSTILGPAGHRRIGSEDVNRGDRDGTTWLGLDPRPAGRGPVRSTWASSPSAPVQYADLDGDGEPDVLGLGPGTGPEDQTLAAFSIATGRPLWSATIDVLYGFSGTP